jgi:hypothetical protein
MAFKIKKPRKRIHSARWDRCVKKVKKQSTAYNPYAVCTARLGRKSFSQERRRG